MTALVLHCISEVFSFMTNPLEGSSILGPILSRIHSALSNAWRDLESLPDPFRADMTARTRAGFLNDRILVHIRRLLDGETGVTFVRGRGGLTLLAFQQQFLIRFKKLRPDLRTSNIPTQQSLAFARQQTLELPGMPPRLTHLNAGYVLNRMQTEIASTHITCPAGREVAWEIPLTAEATAEVVAFTSPDAGTRTTSRVQSRSEGGEQHATGKGGTT